MLELVDDLLVNWSRLIEVPVESKLHSHNRFRTNWFRERVRMSALGNSVKVHRIASKRVVLEVADPAPRNGRRQKSKRILAAVIAFSIAVFVAITVFRILQSSSFNQHQVRVQEEVKVAPSICGAFQTTNPFEVLDVSEFNVEGWNLRTFGKQTLIGAVGSASFEAACAGEMFAGFITYSKTENGYLVLRLAISD